MFKTNMNGSSNQSILIYKFTNIDLYNYYQYATMKKGGDILSLKQEIEKSHKEIYGSRSKNRLSLQISYAIELIIEFYNLDFIILMDYIEDVSVIENPNDPNKIHMYQVKSKKAGSNFTFASIIKDEWFQKLYSNGLKYSDYVETANIVCNADILDGKNSILINEQTSVSDDIQLKNINKIKDAIAKYNHIPVSNVDLSSYYFIKTELTTKNHKQDVTYKFESFLNSLSSDVQIETARALFNIIYDKLDDVFNNELNEDCSNVNEIFVNKGLNSKEIKEIINCGLVVQLPGIDKIFNEFSITSVIEKRTYSKIYRSIKRDMLKDDSIYRKLLIDICSWIDTAINYEIDDSVKIRNYIIENIETSVIYDDNYISLLTMILIYKYCAGDDLVGFNN